MYPGVPGEVSLACGQRYRGGVSDTVGSRATGSNAASGAPAPAKVKHRPVWLVFVVLGAIVCMGMGIWQLARYQAVTGTVQNLGYTFMWPFLAWFLFYAYAKYIRLEADEAAEAAAGGDEGDDPDHDDDNAALPGSTSVSGKNGSGRNRGHVMTEIPADLLPTRRPARYAQPRDEGLNAYNSYLAELAREDSAGDRSQEKPAS